MQHQFLHCNIHFHNATSIFTLQHSFSHCDIFFTLQLLFSHCSIHFHIATSIFLYRKSLKFHRYNNFLNFISFTNTRSSASRSMFLEFFNNNIYIFLMLRFFVCVVFIFYWNEIENAKTKQMLRSKQMWRSKQSNSLQNDVCFSHIGQKLCEKMHF